MMLTAGCPTGRFFRNQIMLFQLESSDVK
jgi:hypothetical protein